MSVLILSQQSFASNEKWRIFVRTCSYPKICAVIHKRQMQRSVVCYAAVKTCQGIRLMGRGGFIILTASMGVFDTILDIGIRFSNPAMIISKARELLVNPTFQSMDMCRSVFATSKVKEYATVYYLSREENYSELSAL